MSSYLLYCCPEIKSEGNRMEKILSLKFVLDLGNSSWQAHLSSDEGLLCGWPGAFIPRYPTHSNPSSSPFESDLDSYLDSIRTLVSWMTVVCVNLHLNLSSAPPGTSTFWRNVEPGHLLKRSSWGAQCENRLHDFPSSWSVTSSDSFSIIIRFHCRRGGQMLLQFPSD